VLGAACPATGQTVGLLSPHLNTGVMNVFLEQLAREVSADAHVLLIWDQAGFHGARRLQVPENITLLPLPPYSPELNPIENLWHYLRAHHWANREYADYDALRAAACAAWQDTCLNPEIVRSVCNAPYLEREVKT
jgi:transposase